ncbi:MULTISPECIES: bacteriocin-like protein [Chryseobacterium]|uniref:Bacteriocin n=1 Tax=Chryseobacterium camelliae TaxID=1265445 RepID=A0ABU0TMS6_9FLAO|nr:MULTISPECIES: hypothetical protein [Chryseobacterium]MDT3407790.1 hypothetical protein [Pseudacidovorax intermedius]MDQ1098355.1 hypothetical protein [Chryseobacterium camelliae]MDQ1102281.1 hypothetical protein [Chryseobacterium sp. SORGH_AS_1048]MDR6085719.1 hypothetical protein [Chryseobacterium sp. SORGH_AS_0909]MDR6130084.1 hypothetical protein [Chryseobacterium sp. SORGH_AS_1175]
MKNVKKLSRNELRTLQGGFKCEGISCDWYCSLPAESRPVCLSPQTLVPICGGCNSANI